MRLEGRRPRLACRINPEVGRQGHDQSVGAGPPLLVAEGIRGSRDPWFTGSVVDGARAREDHGSMPTCASCGLMVDDVGALAAHLVQAAERSDVSHVMWLNRNVSKRRVGAAELAVLLERAADGRTSGEDRVPR